MRKEFKAIYWCVTTLIALFALFIMQTGITYVLMGVLFIVSAMLAGYTAYHVFVPSENQYGY